MPGGSASGEICVCCVGRLSEERPRSCDHRRCKKAATLVGFTINMTAAGFDPLDEAADAPLDDVPRDDVRDDARQQPNRACGVADEAARVLLDDWDDAPQ